MRIPLRVVRIVALVPLLLFGLTSMPSSATAATPMWCIAYGGAPSSYGSAGVITAHYSHKCNVAPANVNMTEGLYLDYYGHASGCYSIKFPLRGYVQTRVDFKGEYAIGTCHGWYQPRMVLTIVGDFVYGAVPGCGRIDPQAVYCEWVGAKKFY